MRNLLIIFILLPFLSFSQSYSRGQNATGDDNVTAVCGTEWQTLLRPTLQNPVNAFYRFSFANGEYRLELKISAGGAPFVVAKNAMLDLDAENCHTITLYNERYESSCRGCGSRSVNADVLGVTLTFRLDKHSADMLTGNYLRHIRLHLADNDLGGTPTLRRSETFRDELVHFMAQH